MDIVRGEGVERELDAMIERRSHQKDANEEHELWKASAMAHDARRREKRRREWAEYHRGQAKRCRAVLTYLVSYHEAEAERCLPEERKTA